jgi:DNA primase
MADTAEQTQYDKDLQDLNAIKKTGVGTSVIAQLEKDFAKKYPNGRPVTPVAASNTEIATALKIATNLGIGEALLNDPTYGAELKKVFERVNNIEFDVEVDDTLKKHLILVGTDARFGARILKSDAKNQAKYLNSPETVVYHKSATLYGIAQAKNEIRQKDVCYLVEGYTDVVSLHQAGVENVVASGGTSLTTDQLRLIKKYCNNLTIVYDGDGAGVKAALRGLDLALEERLNVKLVLIPDNEDPDSYVNKVGATAFKEFVAANKKDFILFQLEVALKDAGNDSAKKSAVVNQVAETIARINRAEDFTRRQDYIKQVSELLKIEETGMNALVNKIIRDKISKEENKFTPAPSENNEQQQGNESLPDSPEELLLNKDELNERALIRCLIEFGQNEWENETNVAAYLLKEIEENELDVMMENQTLLQVLQQYREWYQEGKAPNEKSFLYLENRTLSELVIQLMSNDAEISPKWKEKYEGHIPTRAELFKEEIISCLNYLKLRKIKKMMLENQLELQHSSNPEEQMLILQTHQHLKQMEIQLTQRLGTVIYK